MGLVGGGGGDDYEYIIIPITDTFHVTEQHLITTCSLPFRYAGPTSTQYKQHGFPGCTSN